MLAPRLVQVMREKSDVMSAELVAKIRASSEWHDLPAARVPESEYKRYASEIYQDLTEWLLNRADPDLERRYVNLGRRRASQGVPASHLFCAASIAHECLWDYMRRECLDEDPLEFLGGAAWVRSLRCFFDRVTYFALIGYAQAWEDESAASPLVALRRSA